MTSDPAAASPGPVAPRGPILALQASVLGGPRRPMILDDLSGRPVLSLLLDRLAPAKQLLEARLVVLTSDEAADDPVATLAEQAGWRTVRGSAADPLGTLAIVLVRYPADAIVLCRGDGPLLDAYLVAAAMQLHRATGADHTSNLLPRSYPRGLDVEVLSARAIRHCELDLHDPAERRRFSAHIRRHPEAFRLANLASGHNLADEDWTSTTPDDLARLRNLLTQVHDPVTASWNRILAIGGRSQRTKPGAVALVPQPSPAAGAPAWVQRWRVEVDGLDVGTATVVTQDGRTEPEVEVASEHLEATLDALYHRLAVDAPAPA